MVGCYVFFGVVALPNLDRRGLWGDSPLGIQETKAAVNPSIIIFLFS